MKRNLIKQLLGGILGILVIGATMQAATAETSADAEALKVVHAVTPEIPDGLLKPDHNERVIVEFVVCKEGHVKDARVLYTNHKELKPYVLTAIRQWEFTPKKKAGEAVETRVRLPIEFLVKEDRVTLMLARK